MRVHSLHEPIHRVSDVSPFSEPILDLRVSDVSLSLLMSRWHKPVYDNVNSPVCGSTLFKNSKESDRSRARTQVRITTLPFSNHILLAPFLPSNHLTFFCAASINSLGPDSIPDSISARVTLTGLASSTSTITKY
jgi:hypothetical protein